jgi:hypothetical protein
MILDTKYWFLSEIIFVHKGALETLKLELDVTESLGACFAAKLVRGAYLERERQLDSNNICASYTKTGDNYHR